MMEISKACTFEVKVFLYFRFDSYTEHCLKCLGYKMNLWFLVYSLAKCKYAFVL